MALFSNKKNIRQAKEAAGQMQAGAIFGMEATSANAARNVAAEEGWQNVFSRLGQPGTYGPDAPQPIPGQTIFNTEGTGYAAPDPNLKQFATYGGTGQLGTARQGIIDPEKYGDLISRTVPFQIQSQQVAEAKSLLDREGPAWDRLENSTLGQIHQGSAMQLRDTVRQLKNDFAKGGSARRTALNEVNMIRAQEAAMSMQTEQTWRANLDLHQFVNQNADRVMAGVASFREILPGLGTAYRQAMAESAKLAVFAGESAASIAKEAYEVRASQQAVNFGTKLAEGLIMSAISSAMQTGGQMAGSYISGDYDTLSKSDVLKSGALTFTSNILGTDFSSSSPLRKSGQPSYTDVQQAEIDRKMGRPTEAENYQAPISSRAINPITGKAYTSDMSRYQ